MKMVKKKKKRKKEKAYMIVKLIFHFSQAFELKLKMQA